MTKFVTYIYRHHVAIIGLFVGGTSYAAVQLPAGSVGTKQLKKNAVTAKKIRNGAITGVKIKDNVATALGRRDLDLRRQLSLSSARL